MADFEKKIQAGLTLSEEKQIYFNGFSVTVSQPDVLIVLQRNNEPVVVLNTSHKTAKTMVELLSRILESFENNTEQSILSFQDMDRIAREKADKPAEMLDDAPTK